MAIGKTVALRLLRNQWLCCLCSANTRPRARPNLSAFCELTARRTQVTGQAVKHPLSPSGRAAPGFPEGWLHRGIQAPWVLEGRALGLPRKMSFRYPSAGSLLCPSLPIPTLASQIQQWGHLIHPWYLSSIEFVFLLLPQTNLTAVRAPGGQRQRRESGASISPTAETTFLTPIQVNQPGCTPQGSQGQAVNLYLLF